MDDNTAIMNTPPIMASHISSPSSQAALSFCYAPIESYQYHLCKKEDEHTAILTKLNDTCQNIIKKTNVDIKINASDKPTPLSKNILVDTLTDYNLTLIGSIQALTTARSDLLLNCPLKIDLTLPIPTSECPTTEQCDLVSKETNTIINIIKPEPHKSCFASDHITNIIITGIPEDAEKARVRLLVLLDEAAGLNTHKVHIPLKLQYLIGGRKRTGLHPIIEETCTNIYYPSPFTTAVTGNNNEETTAIYVTGDVNNVTRVDDMLNKLAAQKAKSMYHKSVIMVPQKLDWMLLHRRDEIRKIMHDNGSFVEFPILGSGEDRVSVYAENRVNAERTLRAINFVACSIYEAIFFFNNNDAVIYDAPGTHTFFDAMTNLANMVTQLSQVSGAQVIYKKDPGCIEVMGTERAIRNVYQSLQEMTFLKPFHQGTVFRVESANEQRDFISGKKNGKINKIMKTSGAKIRFLSLASDYNFIIEVDSISFTKALDGLTLLQEELPAEISFFVPEAYHKRIIGVGGKNIQRIMKKYGVYVKFSNTEEFASLGGYYDNEDNVVARTPMKNQINLDNLRHAVMELIHPKDRDYNTRTLTIPFRLHRMLAHDKSAFFDEEIGKKTNTRVLWPDCELALNEVFLVGPEAQIDIAMTMVQSVVPRDYELRAPINDPNTTKNNNNNNSNNNSNNNNSTITALLESDDFKHNVIMRLQEYGVTLRSYPDRFYPEDILIVLYNITIESFPTSLELVTSYLKSKNIYYYEHKSSNLSSSIKPSSVHQYMQDVPILGAFSPGISKSTGSIGPSIMSSHTSPVTNYHKLAFGQSDMPSMSSSTSTQSSTVTMPLESTWKPSSGTPDRLPLAESNIRAIFDAPLDLTEQEKAILANYRYQRMSMPLSAGGFGFGVPPSSSTGHHQGGSMVGQDIWSTQPRSPTTPITSSNPQQQSQNQQQQKQQKKSQQQQQQQPPTPRSLTHSGTMFGDTTMTSFLNPNYSLLTGHPPHHHQHQHHHEFNPYGDEQPLPKQTLKSSKSMPEPLLESHFQQQQQQQQQQSQQHSSSPHNLSSFNPPVTPTASTSSGYSAGLGYTNLSTNRTRSPSTSSGLFSDRNNDEFVIQNVLENMHITDKSGQQRTPASRRSRPPSMEL